MPHITGLFIAQPAFHRMMHGLTHQSLMATGQLLASECVPFVPKLNGCAEIVNLRNLFVTEWYYKYPHLSHMLMVDADMNFSPYMIWDMICFDKPVMGCIYSRREFQEDGTCQPVGKTFSDNDTIDDVVQGFLKVEGVGGGVLMFQRKVIDRMIEKYPEIVDSSMKHSVAHIIRSMELPHMLKPFKPMMFNGGELSEDLSFCKRWTEMGGEVWANVHHAVGHVGEFEFRIRYANHLINRKAQKEAPALPMELRANLNAELQPELKAEQDAAIAAEVASKVAVLAEEAA